MTSVSVTRSRPRAGPASSGGATGSARSADGVVAEPADRAAEEARQPRRDRGRQLGQGVVDEPQRRVGPHLLGARGSPLGSARQDLDGRPRARTTARGRRRRSCRRPTCRRRRRSRAGTNRARGPAWRRPTPACRRRRRARGRRTPGGRGGPGRGNQHNPGRNARAGHHTAPDRRSRPTPSKSGRRQRFGYHRRARGPRTRPILVHHANPSRFRRCGPPYARFVAWTLRHGALLWALAILLAVPAAWRTVKLYQHLRSEVEELFRATPPASSPSASCATAWPGCSTWA